MKLQIARSARETSRNGSADPTNRPRATRMRKLREKKNISVTIKPQQKKTPPSENMIKVVSTPGKTTVKTPYSLIPKTLRKKLHHGTKTNHRSQTRRRGLTTIMKMMTELVPRTTTATATATAEVKGIPAPEEALRNG